MIRLDRSRQVGVGVTDRGELLVAAARSEVRSSVCTYWRIRRVGIRMSMVVYADREPLDLSAPSESAGRDGRELVRELYPRTRFVHAGDLPLV